MSEPTGNPTTIGTQSATQTTAVDRQITEITQTPLIFRFPPLRGSTGTLRVDDSEGSTNRLEESMDRLDGSVEKLAQSIKKLEISINHLSRAINEMPLLTANYYGTALKNAMDEIADVWRIRALDDEVFDSRLVNLDVAPVDRYHGTP